MAILNIVKEGDPLLRKKCRPVTEVTPRILTLLDDMKETLIEANGAGLAAPQVGILRRIALVDLGEEIVELINPEIVETEGEQEEVEGCLSVPDVWGITKRPAWVKVKAMNRSGEEFEVEGEGLNARCLCHEIDHLDGHLFTDNVVHILSPEEVEELMGGDDE
ncbi:MAG: peptide deformylase [Clostridia bacterium]|nr:peptide deformylase [Clostridia bacterium]MBQ3816327.1 peptide deformylase [Clostridia bacterium]MBQ4194437.1 peptide deformylase [Clostridia bacterium]MBR4186719.1 peptide deformylase [Clostridia bacterium]